MSYKEDILELAQGEPLAVRAALRRAVEILEEDNGPEPDEAVFSLVTLGLAAASGSPTPASLIVEGVAALITLGRTIQKKRRRKIRRSRKSGTAAGLAARKSSRKTSAKMNALGAGAAWASSRRSSMRKLKRKKK